MFLLFWFFSNSGKGGNIIDIDIDGNPHGPINIEQGNEYNSYGISPKNLGITDKIYLKAIKRTSLRYGLQLGWQLGRFEFIHGSSFPEAQAVVLQLEIEIKWMLKKDDYKEDIKFTAAADLINKVLKKYSITDPEKHAAILIGLAALRASLAGVSKDKENNIELEEIALSAIMEADNTVIFKKEKFFQALKDADVDNIPQLLEVIDQHSLPAR